MSLEGWQLKRLDEIGEIYSGSTPSTTNPVYWDGDIVWVTPYDLSLLNTAYLNTSSKKITQQGLKNCSAKLLPPQSIILSSRAPIGYIAISTVECCTNQGCKSLRLKEEYNPEFIYHNLKFNIDQIKTLGEGTTFSEISKTALAKVEMFFLEDKKEQEKIAEVLSTVDRAIAQTEALIAKQQRIKTGLMQDLLTKGIDEAGNIRSEETHEFKDSPLGRIPVEWEIVSVKDIAVKITDGDHHTPKRSDDGIFLLSARNIMNGSIDTSEVDYVSEAEYERMIKRCHPETGDILISCSGTIGRICVVPQWLKCVLVRSAALIKLNQDKIFPNYAEWVLSSEAIQSQIKAGQRQAAQANLFQSEIAVLKFPIAKLSEQIQINKILNAHDLSIQRLTKTLKKLKSQKTGLMQDLLNGKVPVTPLINK